MRRDCAHLISVISILVVFHAFSYAATYTAASCKQTDVQTAISNENATPADGDIIAIPAGSCTWTGNGLSATFSHSVTIQGAGAISATTGGASTTGTDSTALTNNTNGSLMWISTTAGKSLRITGIAVLENSSSVSQGTGNLVIDGESSQVRIDHCHFYLYVNGSKGLGFVTAVTGVADHIYINTPQQITNDLDFLNGGNWQGQADPNSLGDQSWADTDHFGTSEFMYVEDTQINGGYVGDCSNGGRYVIRYSTVLNTYGMANHGTHDPWRSCRATEFYHNTFNLPASCPYGSGNCSDSGGITHQNGGTTLLWGNTISGLSGSAGYYYAIDLSDVRQSNSTYSQAPPPAGWGYCGSSQSGTSSAWDGDTNSDGYPCLDQPGRGAGDLLAGYPQSSILDITAGKIITWPHQALSPIYVWANTVTGTPLSIVGNNTGTLLADNRDYFQQFGTYGESGSFNGTAGVGQGLASALPSACSNANHPGSYPGPGYWATDTNTLYVCTATNTWTAYYTPYTYPHPLTGSGNQGPAAPTGLVTVVQ